MAQEAAAVVGGVGEQQQPASFHVAKVHRERLGSPALGCVDASVSADVLYWVEHQTYPVDEVGCRFHHRLVAIHPFPNGNGRHARIMTSALLSGLGVEPFTWGSGPIDSADAVRERYFAALREANEGDYAQLISFVRR
ncbi:MAG TPA: mobile mystery protein B [Gemmatimonadales bacterium]